ncbi:sulfatase-like hydrolase/transferase [Cyclobacterium sp. SYSU L10401]|uniref:sulfatase-like hydrolase/transferase n=1 Tax=Cyclobacterium sp. SYSU L10401 TaxID=2678657 RepID=UPI0013D89007|nr:sulfatase-like hydrolase/transferase [Cyclobacterium sp. SYSU L10401]
MKRKFELFSILILFTGITTTYCRSTHLPNIVILLADDLGYRDLSCYGSTQVQTPNLDRFAAEEMRFTDFYAGSAVYSPCRVSLITGRSSVRVGIYYWIHTSQKCIW